MIVFEYMHEIHEKNNFKLQNHNILELSFTVTFLRRTRTYNDSLVSKMK